MFSFSFKKIDINFDNIIFSSKESRPSKTLIDIDTSIFKKFIQLNISELSIYDLYNLNIKSKPIEYFLLEVILSKLNINISFYEDFTFSFDDIILNEIKSEYKQNIEINKYNNIFFIFEKNVNQQNIIENFLVVLNEIQYNDSVIINSINLYTYSNLELILLISSLFKKFKIYFCKILKQDIIIFKNFEYYNNLNNESNESNLIKIIQILKEINKKIQQKIYLKQIGFEIDIDILKFIKFHNLNYMKYYIDLNQLLFNITLNEESDIIFKLFSQKYIKNNYGNANCILNCNNKFINY